MASKFCISPEISHVIELNVLFTGLPRWQMSDEPLAVYTDPFDLALIPRNNSEELISICLIWFAAFRPLLAHDALLMFPETTVVYLGTTFISEISSV